MGIISLKQLLYIESTTSNRKMKIWICLLIGVAQCRNLSNREEDEIIVFEEGFNPGQSQSNGQSGYNAGDQQNGGSGYNAGDQQNNQFNPHIPDFIPDESITNSGSSGFNPGRDNSLSLGSARPNSRPDPSGRPDAHPNINSGFNPAAPGLSGFRTPIIFAEEEEED